MSEINNKKELFKKLERLQWLLHRHHQQLHSARGPFAVDLGEPHAGEQFYHACCE